MSNNIVMEYTEIDINEWIDVKTYPHLKFVSKGWITNDRLYLIYYDEIDKFKHLRITRCDDQPIHNYMDIFQIKNDLLGTEIVAIEIYPKKSNFRDGSHTYHIWTWEGIKTPDLTELYEYFKKSN